MAGFLVYNLIIDRGSKKKKKTHSTRLKVFFILHLPDILKSVENFHYSGWGGMYVHGNSRLKHWLMA